METDLMDKAKESTDDLGNESVTDTDENDVALALKLTGHATAEYPNGITLGVKLEGVHETRGVHVDIVFVLDLRKAVFGKGGLAMRAAVLETVNRDLEKVMCDVNLGESLYDHYILTPWGRIHLSLLKGSVHRSLSMMHETRTIYVVTQNAKPSFDLSWLTDTGRIVTIDEFSLVRQSDARSKLPELKKNVQAEKWHLLETGLLKGWSGLLAVIAMAIGVLTAVYALTEGSGSIFVPVLVSGVSGVLGAFLLRSSRISIISFQKALSQEQEQLRCIGDSTRILESIVANEDRLQLIADLNFIVSPLLATLGIAIGNHDIDTAVSAACSALDECVRLAPRAAESSSTIRGDEGLQMFIGLFKHLGGSVDEAKLALAYVGLTSHITKPLTFGEAVSHITELVNSLYNIGALRPNIKETLDDKLNMVALKETVQEINRDMQSEDRGAVEFDPTSDAAISIEQKVSEQRLPSENYDISSADQDLHEQILHASAESPQHEDSSGVENTSTAKDDSDDDLSTVAADVIKSSMKKQKIQQNEPTQLVLDDIEYLGSSNDSKAERESAGV